MWMVPSSVRIFVALGPTDMRKGFDGLAAQVRAQIKQEPLNGHLYVFRNRRKDRVKILYWDRHGLALWYKRLEQGTFHFPQSDTDAIEMSATDLSMILEGIDLKRVQKRKRYVHQLQE